jgi:hypothetical protein
MVVLDPPLRARPLAGLGSMFVGLGLARFALTPLVPVLVAGCDRSFSSGLACATASVLLGAAPLGIVWLLSWCVVGGFAGGLLMVVAAPTTLAGSGSMPQESGHAQQDRGRRRRDRRRRLSNTMLIGHRVAPARVHRMLHPSRMSRVLCPGTHRMTSSSSRWQPSA